VRRQEPVFSVEALDKKSGIGTRPPVDLFINGKFIAQRSSGVQRVARSLLFSLDDQIDRIQSSFLGRLILLLPRETEAPELRCIETAFVGPCGLPLHLWEQFQLPFSARDGLLLNLSGSAPLLARRQMCLIHDAAVFDRPQAYTPLFRRWYQTLFRLLAWRQTPLLTVSAFSRQRLALRLGIAETGIHVVPNGAEHLQSVAPDPGILTRLGLTPERYLLAVGSDNPNKNLPRLQSAFALLSRRQDVKLVIVGGADPLVFADQPMADGGAAEAVIRTGPLSDAALKALYRNAAGLVFPSLYEGFGLPPLEAMSCGCPVAASNAAAIPQVCGDAALYFDPTSIEQMAQTMQALLDDAALRDGLRRAGARRVQAFTWPRAAEALLSQLRRQLAPRSQTPRPAAGPASGSRP
jgi:glycosyltransferase involved in cell wall biosynthesis